MTKPEKTDGRGASIPESAPAPAIEETGTGGAPINGAPADPEPPTAADQTAAAGEAETEPENEEHEKLQRDLEELSAKASKADEYLELAQRTKADFENYRRRAAREAAAAQERGVAKLAKELLPAVDNLDRALAAAEAASDGETLDTLASGIKLVHADVIAALARAGIERYSPEGEVFDPQQHEAVAQQPVDGAQPGTIVEVYQRGYRLGDAVIRPARVVVAG
jgi:molecular chaperone GrpE